MAESAHQATADRVSEKLQKLYNSMDEHEQSVLEGILSAAGDPSDDVSGFSSARYAPVSAFNEKIIRTPVAIEFKNKGFEIPVLVLCW